MALSVCGKSLLWAVAGLLVLADISLRAEDLEIKEIELPPLRVQGQPARAHTQGMELVDGKVLVTARREDVRPRRALLLRVEPAAENWDVWDITPLDSQGEPTNLDHPGGMQSDGTRLWIPLAESRRNGRSLVCAYRLKDLEGGRLLKPDVEFAVNDHIGAVAVAVEQKWLLGASWDTEKVYLLDFDGRLLRTLGARALKSRELGVAAGEEARSGLAVQDWKFVGNRLFASGLLRTSATSAASAESRLTCFTNLLDAGFQRWTVKLPLVNGAQLAREAMTISDGVAHFLPEDLHSTNRMFRVSLTNWFSDLNP
jgi:hypothetical protein